MQYTVILERDPEGIVVAHVPALRGCVPQGKNKREALRNVKEAIGLYVETLIEHGAKVALVLGLRTRPTPARAVENEPDPLIHYTQGITTRRLGAQPESP